MGKKIKICVFTGNRAEYGLLRPIIKSLIADKRFSVSLIVSGSHLSDLYGNTSSEIETSDINTVVKIKIEESDQIDVVKSFSMISEECSMVLLNIKPNLVLVAGDRYETFAFVISAFYNNFPIAHVYGGDLSQGGHLDDSVRHSITKLSHIHFTTNIDSFRRVLKLGEESWRVFNVGSPLMDVFQDGDYSDAKTIEEELAIDMSRPFILFTQHPVTTESHLAYKQVKQSLEALKELGIQTIITYPCNDNGSKETIMAINEYANTTNFRIIKSLGWKMYLGCMNTASCVVGNSSSGIMETPIFKVPCVNIGDRQKGRLRAENVIDTPYDKNQIKKAIIKATTDANFKNKVSNCVSPYGNAGASLKIVNILNDIISKDELLKKQMTY